jgi:hypothetical protein
MTDLRRFLLFYIIGLGLLFIVLLIFGGQWVQILSSIGFWILPAVVSLFGFLVGAGVYELMLKPVKKRSRLFILSHLSLLLCFITLVVVIEFQEWDFERKFGNFDHNHGMFKHLEKDDPLYVKAAFKELESSFVDPNSFRLTGFSANSRDTSINGLQYPVYNIYFTYFQDADSEIEYFSKVSVMDGVPSIKLHNLNAATSEEFWLEKVRRAKLEGELMSGLRESFDELPDTLRKKLVDTLKYLIDK